MVWIESHQSLGAHPKTKKLARLLDVSIPTAVGHLHCLWWWAMDYAQDGCLARYDDLDVAVGAMWEGEPETFRQALHAAGFLDPDEAIHDWDDYAGKLIARREANAERMRNARAGTKDDRAAHVQRTQRARASLPDQPIKPNQPTVPPISPPARPPTPVPKPTMLQPKSGYEKELNGAMPRLVTMFVTMNKLLNEKWMRDTLRKIEPEIGPLARDKLGQGLDLAAESIRTALATGRIGNPPGFAKSEIVKYLKEQADVHVA